MNFKGIEEFITLSEHMSFKEAARELEISPATLSERIKVLEKNIGYPLITHVSNTVSLTSYGALFLADAKSLDSDFKQALDRLHHYSDDETHTLSIAISGNGMPPRLESLLIDICRLFPNVQLSISDDSIYSIKESLSDGDIDLYFSYIDPSQRDEGINKFFLFSSQLCAVVWHSHSLSRKAKVQLSELENETFFLYPKLKNPALHNLEYTALAKSGIKYNLAPGNVSKTFFLNPVGSGLGVSLCPWVLRDHIPRNTVAIPLQDSAPLSMYMMYSKNNYSPLLHTFIRMIKKTEF
jgi:DNA-binding transcriptional LysR family regulator